MHVSLHQPISAQAASISSFTFCDSSTCKDESCARIGAGSLPTPLTFTHSPSLTPILPYSFHHSTPPTPPAHPFNTHPTLITCPHTHYPYRTVRFSTAPSSVLTIRVRYLQRNCKQSCREQQHKEPFNSCTCPALGLYAHRDVHTHMHTCARMLTHPCSQVAVRQGGLLLQPLPLQRVLAQGPH